MTRRTTRKLYRLTDNRDIKADGYHALEEPLAQGLDGLRSQVKELLSTLDTREAPPPLPQQTQSEDLLESTDSGTFLQHVEASLEQSASPEDSTASQPASAARSSFGGHRTTADAKLDMLRQKLRQREGELAKLMQVYRAKEREYHAWNEKLVERDIESQSLRMTLEEISQQAEDLQGELERRTVDFQYIL